MNNFYEISNLSLSDEYISDPVLLALAWKRSHNYIRSFNWYADNFELDKTSLFLAKTSKEWADEIKEENFELEPLKLVPAPKTYEWIFKQKNNDEKCLVWEPKPDNSQKELSLRPLAHIGIKEQTFFTLLMMCLANQVESEQGDPSLEFDKVHVNDDKEEAGKIVRGTRARVVNYGNRLYCTYDENGKAEHNYGATTIYSKYFVDYRKFLQRPYYFAQKQMTEKLPNEDVYIVELDLKRFFDTVNREKLTSKIKEFIKTDIESDSVNYLLTQFNHWKWHESAQDEYKYFCSKEENEEIADGIPQGLVAGGFFANIYLLGFDQEIQKYLGKCIENQETPNSSNDNQKLKLVDYCRYVDDIRLVITTTKLNKNESLDRLKEILHKYITGIFNRLHLDIELNCKKTKITPYRAKKAGISKQLNDIQSKVSGPMDLEQTNDIVSELEVLLSMTTSDVPEQAANNYLVNNLANIERNTFDVREDTLRRFAANQLAKHLNEIRHFTSRETDNLGNSISGDWDYLQERIARKLIATWSKDPSLVSLLKKGLELFPDPKLLKPVLEQFELINGQRKTRLVRRKQAIMRYLLAEIFRHSATVIHRKDSQSIPAHANINSYFELLQKKAADIIPNSNKITNKWCFLADQARFLLLVRLDTLLENESGNAEQDVIFKLTKGFRNITTSLDSEQLAMCILIADQLVENNNSVIRSTNELLIRKRMVNTNKILRAIALQNTNLVEQLVKYARQLKSSWVENVNVKKLIKTLYLDIPPSRKPLEEITGQQSIIQLIIRPDNPFANEIMAIKLMQALITAYLDRPELKENDLTPLQIDLAETAITFSIGYSKIPRFESFKSILKIEEIKFHETEQSKALNTYLSGDQIPLQKIAFVIRSALASSKDITGFGKSFVAKPSYRGLKSTQLKRQLGLYTTPESLAGEGAEVTGWLTTLISKLLRWPGIRVHEQGYKWPDPLNFKNVSSLLKERLALLEKNYCQLSNIPALPELITPQWHNKKNLKVAMVQSKMPSPQDFKADIYLDNPQYRSKHRQHIARVASLTLQHIKAQQLEKNKANHRDYDTDLIIFPELAIHQDDLDILIRLSKKTHAIIFAGLNFLKINHYNHPINTAIWIVPRKHSGNQTEILRFQGKQNMTKGEISLNIQPWRPYQLLLELRHPQHPEKPGFIMTGAICYDSTDIKLSADLTNKSNALIISALNKDVATFDSMVEALHYHMYQHVVLVNSGEFGSSYAMAPYKEHHEKLIAHSKGKDQVSINTFEMNMFDFRRDGIGSSLKSDLTLKTPPAGVIILEN
ncbi:RNA-directed DNA polymerase [Acinetobacter guillouiae]|uniref:RNA-directed DNA polymerase n=1 Tax=Acinetobacter guillouiae TaxID=106649 RepID=UPI003AF5E5BB